MVFITITGIFALPDEAFRQFRSVASKAAKLVCVLVLAVAPLFNTWHSVRSGQNKWWPASFDWCNILRPTHRLLPLLAPSLTPSLFYLHGRFIWIMGAYEVVAFVA